MVASRETIDTQQALELKEVGANYIAVTPYAFMPKSNEPRLFFNTEKQWSGETLKGTGSDIRKLKKQGLNVMIKPHIWVGSGIFTGEISMNSNEDWTDFEDNYRAYILAFANLAEENEVLLFCLGTELNRFATVRKEFWCNLITEVKKLYSGKLTYAENWDKYQTIAFWEELDFIGIDAYFPVSDSKTPEIESINLAWKPLRKELKAVSNFYSTPILFTEYGYRSTDFAGNEPWDSSRNSKAVNELAQLNLLKGLHENVWNEPWFAGGFLWKWFPFLNPDSKRNKNRFSIQNKISEDYLESFYNEN